MAVGDPLATFRAIVSAVEAGASIADSMRKHARTAGLIADPDRGVAAPGTPQISGILDERESRIADQFGEEYAAQVAKLRVLIQAARSDPSLTSAAMQGFSSTVEALRTAGRDEDADAVIAAVNRFINGLQ